MVERVKERRGRPRIETDLGASITSGGKAIEAVAPALKAIGLFHERRLVAVHRGEQRQLWLSAGKESNRLIITSL